MAGCCTSYWVLMGSCLARFPQPCGWLKGKGGGRRKSTSSGKAMATERVFSYYGGRNTEREKREGGQRAHVLEIGAGAVILAGIKLWSFGVWAGKVRIRPAETNFSPRAKAAAGSRGTIGPTWRLASLRAAVAAAR